MSFFGPMSKRKILQGIEEQISNKRYLLTETMLSDEPMIDKDKSVERLKADIAQLRQLKHCLEPLLE